MAVTIRDVARAAGVSPATVSRVLNGNTEVADYLKARVHEAVAQLGYRPNSAARNLRRRTTNVLAMVISNVTNPFFTSMVRGVEDAARTAGFSVVLANTDEDTEREQQALDVAVGEQMAGVLLCPADSAGTDVAALRSAGVPLAVVDRELLGEEVDTVVIDNERAARTATEHLLAPGRRRVALVSGPAATTTGADRMAGYRAAVRAAGLPPLVARADFHVAGGHAATVRLLDAHPGLDGLLVSNNQMALGALTALRERGLEKGSGLGFVSFDAVPWARLLTPTLTVVEQPTYELGRRAAELLLARIAEPQRVPEKVVLPVRLVVGGSSAG